MAGDAVEAAVSGTAPRAEQARPPGWTPRVRPPAPAALPAAAFRPAPPTAPRRPPRPAPAASAAAAPALPAAPARPGGFGVLACMLGLGGMNRVVDLALTPPTGGVADAAERLVQVGLLACGAALVVGLWNAEQWVGRAAVAWAAFAVVSRMGEEWLVTEPSLSTLFYVLVIPAAVATYVWEAARDLSAAPPP